MEKRTQTGLVMGHAYGVTAVKKVNLCNYMYPLLYSLTSSTCMYIYSFSILTVIPHVITCNLKFVVLSPTLLSALKK